MHVERDNEMVEGLRESGPEIDVSSTVAKSSNEKATAGLVMYQNTLPV